MCFLCLWNSRDDINHSRKGRWLPLEEQACTVSSRAYNKLCQKNGSPGQRIQKIKEKSESYKSDAKLAADTFIGLES